MRRPPSRRLVTAAGTALAAGVVAWAFRAAPVPVEIGTVVRGPMEVTVDEEGRTRVRERFVMAAPVSGRLARITLREGDVVAEGTVVARIAPLPLDPRMRTQAAARLSAALATHRAAEASLAELRTALEQARRTRARTEALAADSLCSPDERERAELAEAAVASRAHAAEHALEVAAAQVEEERAALLAAGGDDAARGGRPVLPVLLRAPAAGTVLRVLQESERPVGAGTPLLELGDVSRLELVVDLLSEDAAQVQAGARVELSSGGRELVARVRRVEPGAFTKVSALGVEEQRVNVIADLGEAAPSLGDGYRLDARFVVWECDDVLRAPASALFRRAGGWSVFVIEGGRARARRVDVGHRNPSVVEILGGLSPGQSVVLHPSDQVAEGVRVRPASTDR